MLQQWSKLTDDDINHVKGLGDVLLGKLQERYGIAREAAERQIEDWMVDVGEQAGAGFKAAVSIQGAYEHWFERMREMQRQSIELTPERMLKAMELPVRFASVATRLIWPRPRRSSRARWWCQTISRLDARC